MKIINSIIDLIFPKTCSACGDFCKKELCEKCLSEIKFIGPVICKKCGVPLGAYTDRGRCLACNLARPSETFYDCLRGVCVYEGSIKKLISNLKYNRKEYVHKILAELMAKSMNNHSFLKDCNLIVPVPLHWRKKFIRGFNQSALLAGYLAYKTGLPLETSGVFRKKPTKQQVKLTRQERVENVKDAFSVKKPDVFKSKKILLIDDVATTGETLNQCAKALKGSGAISVYGFTLARDV